MALRILNVIWSNIGTLLMAFGLALAVWISAVISEDPNLERDFSRPVVIDIQGLDEELVIFGNFTDQVVVRLRAPSSVWQQLDSERELISAVIDLTGFQSGVHEIPIEVFLDISPVGILSVEPSFLQVQLEPLVIQQKNIRPLKVGEPALGFEEGTLTLTTNLAQISGPQSLIELVDQVVAEYDISGSRESINLEIELRPVNVDGQFVSGVMIVPERINIVQQVSQAGGYRDVAVKVETSGQLASGYRVTNISVSPPTVTVFSSNPELVAEMPGFVSTDSLDIADADDDLEVRITLSLPDGVALVGEEQSVQVQIGIAAIETSVTISVPVEAIGLAPGMSANISPAFVDVFLFGPIHLLEEMIQDDVRIFVNLADLEAGTHLVVPQEELLSDKITVDAIAPETIEVVISIGENEEIIPEPTTTPGT
ncbi:MAG: CdaR family protein [Chloroflexota bacterium]